MLSQRLRLPPLGLTAGIVLYALAMAYLEAAVVVYLRAALGVPTGTVFPIDLSPAAMPFGWIEVGREGATLVMIGTETYATKEEAKAARRAIAECPKKDASN